MTSAPARTARLLPPVAGAALLLVVWSALARWVPHHLVASPLEAARALWLDLGQPAFYANVGVTLERVVWGFAISLAAGIAVGVWLGLRPAAERAFGVWLTVALTVPSLFYVIVSFMVMGPTEAAAVLAIAATACPLVAVNVIQGVRALDPGLGEMAAVYGLPPTARLRAVLMPQIAPYIVAAGRFGLGTVWKITIFVELIGRSNGVGYMMNYWFQLFQMDQVFAWSGAFTLFMLAVEFALFRPVERRLFRWREEASL